MKNEERLLADFETDYREELEFRKSSLAIRKQLLDNIRSDKSEVARAISDLEKDAGTVSDLFADLENTGAGREGSPELKGLEIDRGNLIWPVQGRIVRPYGTSKDKRGITLTNPGIDIQGIAGAGVMASAVGTVIYVSWLRGYGQFVILNHGREYYTLYANLSNIYVETGDLVQAGEVIAEVGDVGSLEGSRLHFELRHKKESIDPVKWLR
jgi:septal ring factor EnvC (AmiA/AmiB activator)